MDAKLRASLPASDGNTIGGSTAGADNVISASGSDGIVIDGNGGSTTDNNIISGNYIGTDKDGTANLGNGGEGVNIFNGADNNTIGGTAAGAGNIVAYSGSDGIQLESTAGVGNAILSNSVFSNTGMGIDIGASGVLANDSGDGDSGANNLQNFPLLDSATTTGVQITIAGKLTSTANSYYRVEFFSSISGDVSGNGEAEIYLGFVNVSTNGSGEGSYDVTLTAAVADDAIISATATKSDATYTSFTDTSEFAANISAVAITLAPTDLSNGIELNTDGGNDAYLVDSTSGLLYLDGMPGFTAEFSFSDLQVPATSATLYSNRDPGASSSWLAINADGTLDWTGYKTTASFNQLFDGDQHTVAVTWDVPTGNLDFYVDGAFVESVAGPSGASTVAGGTLVIGQHLDYATGTYDPDNHFSGTLHDVRFWGSVLSSTDISLNHNHKFDASNIPTGLVANWQMDGFDGSNEVVDIVSGNNLSIGHAVEAGFTASTPTDALNVDENSTTGTRVGFVIPTDPDVSNNSFTYSMSDASNNFQIDINTGEITVAATATLDFETNTSHNVDVTVTDSVGNSYLETLTINVNDVNDVPIVDLNGTNGGGINFVTTFTEDGGAVNVTDTDAIISDVDDTTFQNLGINLSNMSDGANELITVGGYTFTYGVNEVVVRTVGGTDFELDFDGSGFSITKNLSGNMPLADLQSLVRGITYENTSQNPTTGNRTIDFIVQDASNLSSLTATSTLTVSAVNDAPTASATAINPTYTEGNAAVDLFSTVNVDTVESGQTIKQIVLTVTNVTDGSNETISIDGSVVFLTNGDNDTTGGGFDYIVTISGNTATITIDHSGASVVAVQNLIDGLSYQNTSQDPTAASRVVTLTSITDSGGGTDTSNPNITSTVNVVAVNDAPILSANSVNPTYTEGGAAVSPFNFVSPTVYESGQTIDELIFTVTNVSDGSNELINLDGSTFALTDLASGTTATNGYGYSVSLVGNTATLTLSTTGATPANIANLFISLSYENNSENPTTLDRVFTITSIKDSGGTANGGIDTSSPNLVSTVTVVAVNDVPVATGNTVIATEDIPLMIGAGDFSFTDIESDSLASVTITGLTLNGGTLTHSSGVVTVTNGMTVTAAQLADLTFTSALNDSTNSSFTYTVNDAGTGVTSAVMNITVNAVNDVPVATGNTVIASEDVPLVIGSGDFNFTDVESDSLASVTITGLTLNGGTLTHSAGAVAVTNGMTITAAQLADLTFTSALNDSTDSSFTYTVNDAGAGVTSAVVNITVNAVNDVPVATGNTVIANEDVPLVIGVGDFNFTDVESDSLASVTITGLTLNGGTLTHSSSAVTVTNGMAVTAAQLADLTFTSASNDSTNSSFTYTVNDAGTGVTSAMMNITVNAVNDVPVATGNTVIASEDVPLVIGAGDFNFTDTEGDSLASVMITGLNLNGGTLTHTGGSVNVTNGMTITAAQLAGLTFTSASNDSTDSSFTYTANDAGSGVTSAVMNITVNAVNDVPVATGNIVIANEDVPLVIGPSDFNFTDVESDTLASVTITGLTLNGGTLTHSAGAVTVTNGMTITTAQLADLIFTSASNDSTDSSFTYTVNDAGTGVTSAIMNITVNAVNDVPVATGNTVIASEDVPLVIGAGDFNFTDIESDSLVSVTITGLTLNGGTLTHSAGAVTVTNGMTVTLAQLADLTFTSASNDSNNSSFTYTVNDAGSGVTSAIMNITVNAVNDVPIATGNTVVASEDVPLVISASDFNFTDVESDALASVTITGLTLNGGTLTHSAGTVTVTNGMTVTAAELADLTFTSGLNDSTDSNFTYTVNDAGTGVTSAVMNITVNAVNDVPVAMGNTVIASEDVPLVIGAGDFNFTDTEGDSLASVTITGLSLNGGTLTHSAGAVTVTNGMTITVAQLADLTFTSALNDSSNSSFTYTVNDTGSGVTSAVMNITVNAVNDVPVATGNTVIANEDEPLVIGASDFNFIDVEGDSLASVTITGLTLNGGTLTHTGGVVTVTNGMTITAAQLADLTFTSASNDSTDSSFTYTVNDAGTGVISAVMNITVNAVNDVPVATGNTVIASEDVPLVIGAGDFNFTDVESDSLSSVTITGLTLNGGTLTHSAGAVTVINGMTITAAQLADLTFTSALNDSTDSSFTYTVNDAGTGVTSAIMNITVNALNDVPVATGNTVIANEDIPLVIGAGDFTFTDTEGDSLASVTITGLTLNGGTLTHTGGTINVTNGMTVTAAQLADLMFTSALNDSTDSSFIYTVNDAGTGVTSAVMNITVNAVNDVPVATGNTVIASEDVPLVIGVSDFNFTDVESDALASVTITGLNLNGGTLTHTGGTVNVTNGMTLTAAQLADLTFSSALNDSTDSSFTYTVNDTGTGVTSAVMNITVNAVNDVPVATGNTVIANEDVPLVIGPGDFNFSDIEGNALTSVTITGLTLNGGTLTHSAGAVNVTNGMTITAAQLADLTFTPALNDSTDSSFTYTVNDVGAGVTSSVMNITVNAVNDVPVATGNTVIATEDVPLVIGAGDFNFTDVESDSLVSVTISALNLNGGTLTHSAGAVTVTNGMTVTAAQLADLTFTSASNDSTNSSFTYTVNDTGTGVTSAIMNITVNAVNDVPVATGNTVIASEDVPLVIGAGDFNFTDVESDSLVSVTITGLTLNGGTLTHSSGAVTVTNGMTVTAAQLADLTFTSASNDSTNSSFTYTVNDVGTGVTSAVMNITVNAVNDVPVATGNTVIASEDVPLVIDSSDFNFTDVESDSLASVTITGLTLNGGTLTHSAGAVTVTSGMTVTAAQLTDLTFTSASNDSTNSSFTYTVNDAGIGVTSAVMNITVNAVNDVPVATGNTVIASEDVPLVIGAGDFNFTDVESDSLVSVTITGLTLNGGTLTHSAGAVTVTNGMTITAAQLADLTFTSASNDSTDSSFTYTVNDAGTGIISAIMNITINAVNDVPVATGNTVIANEDVPLVIGAGDFNFTDTESDSLASVTITGLTLNGGALTRSAGAVTVTNGMTITATELADLTFTSASNNSTNTSFTYTVNDAGAGVTSAVMNITVNAVNDVPVATGNTVIANEDVPLVIGAGDFNFTDVESDSLVSVTITSLTLNGGTLTHSVGAVTVTNGMTITAAELADLTFTSALNDSTNSSFTYTVNDAGTGATSAVMNITVNAVNDVPVATGNTVIANEDVPLVIGAGDFNFTDVESDGLASVTITGLNLNGGTLTHTGGTVNVTNGMTVTAAQLADLTFTSALNDSTNSSFTYTVNDAGAGLTSAVMNITVNPSNDAPVANPDTTTTTAGTERHRFSVLSNDVDIDGDKLIVTRASAANGTVRVNEDGSLSYTPNVNFSGIDTITYDISDGKGGVATTTVKVTVVPQDGNPFVDSGVDPSPDLEVDSDDTVQESTEPQIIDPVQPIPESTETEEPQGVKRALLEEILQSFQISDEILLPMVEKSKPGADGRSVIKFSLKRITLNETFQAVQLDELTLIPEDSELWAQLDRMKDEMSLDLEDDQAAMTVVAGTTVTFTAGFVSWILRSGSLMASFLSSVPLFKQFDPLPILNTTKQKAFLSSKRDDDEGTDDNPESRLVEELFGD